MKKQHTMKLSVPVEKTVEKLETAWSLKFANQTFSGFCNNVCKGRFAGKCETCPVYQAYEAAKQQIQDGLRSKPEYQDCKISYGAYRHFDGKGHKTEVWHSELEMAKKEVR